MRKLPETAIEPKEFLKKLQRLSHSHSPHRIFSDWLEIAAISMHQLPYRSGELEQDNNFERLEAQYMERIKPYSKEELAVFGELFGLTASVHQNGFYDFLGEVAGEASLLSKRGGQFFTPYHLCRAIAKKIFVNVEAQVKEKGGIVTVCEPAVGAGALVIASAEEVASQGIDPRAHLQFDCTDVSRDAFNMAYIQLSALGLQAVVRHGNTLSGEYWEHRPTLQLRLFDRWLTAKREERQRVEAMKAILTGLCSPELEVPLADENALPKLPSDTLFDLEQFTAPRLSKTRADKQPDVDLGKQMELFA